MIPQAEKYLNTLARSDNTIITYRHCLEFYFRLAGDELNDKVYESFWSDPGIKHLAESSKRLISSAVMGLYEFCEIGDITKRRKANRHYLKPNRFSRAKFKFQKIKSVDAIIAYCESLEKNLINLRDRAFVLMLADGGFRISELVGLARGDIDFERERVIVSGKGDKTAVIRLSKRSLRALKEYLRKRQRMDGKSGRALESLPLFAQHGRIKFTKAMTVDGMRKAIKTHMEQAGHIVRIHDFRHYFVTKVLLSSKGNMKLAQELARHEDVGTTQRYAHLADEYLDAGYDEIFNRSE